MSVRMKRYDLPPFKILRKKFDFQRLSAALTQIQATYSWDGLSAEYAGLCKVHERLPPYFFGDEDKTQMNPIYSQLALTEFDDQFALSHRSELSGTRWDRMSPHRNRVGDERFYRKRVANIPSYLEEVLDFFGPSLHRARFAKIEPGAKVQMHVDYDTTYSVRYHIALQTSPQCKLGVRLKDVDEEYHLPADGSVAFLNQGLPHWATNPSDKPRIHLILSVDSQAHLEL